MIKFFRHIRQSQIEQDKMGKYFKYAIGEILLVVVGILIALQINNWNENRKAASNERVLLEKLKEENHLNLSTLEDHVNYREAIPEEIENFIELLNQGNLETKTKDIQNYLNSVLSSTVYTFTQSNLINYLNTHNYETSRLTKELAKLEGFENDLELVSDKGVEIKFKNVFEALEESVDLSNGEIASYETLESLKFKNKMMVVYGLEDEISIQFNQTYNQLKKVDSLITERLKK